MKGVIEKLKMQSGDSSIPGFFSLPQSKATGKWPGLLIFHGTESS